MRTNQKLTDISEGQKREIDALKEHLTRLQLRSFPSFPMPHHQAVVHPDLAERMET